MIANVQAFISNLQASFGEQGPQILENLQTAINALAEIWREHGDEIMEVTRIVFEVVMATISGAAILFTGIITAALQLIQGDWSGAWETMQETLSSFLEGVLNMVGTSTEEFLGVWTDVWELLKTIVAQGTMNVTSGIQDWLIKLINTMREWLGAAYQFGIDFANNIILGVLQMAGQIAQTAADVVTGAVKAAAAALGGAASAASTATAPHRAGGGMVSAGNAYIVGENGPELFTASQSGRIIPGGATGMGTTVGEINIHIDGSGDPAAVAMAVIRELQMRDLIPATSML